MLCSLARALLHLSPSLNNVLVASAKLWGLASDGSKRSGKTFSLSRRLWKTARICCAGDPVLIYFIYLFVTFLAANDPLPWVWITQTIWLHSPHMPHFRNVLTFHQNVGASVGSSGCCWWSVCSRTFSLSSCTVAFPAWRTCVCGAAMFTQTGAIKGKKCSVCDITCLLGVLSNTYSCAGYKCSCVNGGKKGIFVV